MNTHSPATSFNTVEGIVIATGRRRDDREFINRTFASREAFEAHYFTDFERGPKDGACILQGALVPKAARGSKNVPRNICLSLDVDNGRTLESAVAALEAARYAAILYHTHSNGTTETEIGQDALDRHIKKNGLDEDDLIAAAQTYLRDVKGYVEDIVASITDVTTAFREGGVKYIVEHAPMEKFRIFMWLQAPFEFSGGPGESQTARIEFWKAKYKAVAKLLGIVVDEKCVDPARLFYIPRIAVKADASRFQIVRVDGADLDLDAVEAPEAAKSKLHGLSAELGVSGAQYQTANLKKFAAIGVQFLASQFANHQLEFRADKGEDRGEYRCPHDDMHSDPGNPTDKAFLAVDWSDEGPWHMGCQHETCSKHCTPPPVTNANGVKVAQKPDRLLYLDKACADAGILDAVDLLTWCANEDEARVLWGGDAAPKVDVAALIKAAPRGVPSDEIIAAIARVDGETQREAHVEELARVTGSKITTLRGDVKRVRKEQARAHVMAVAGAPRVRAAPPLEDSDHSEVTEVWAHWSYPVRKRVTVRALEEKNVKNPNLFYRPGSGVVRLIERADDVTLDEMGADKAKWIYELTERLNFVTQSPHASEDDIDAEPMGDIVTHLQGKPDLKVPRLERVVTVPVFAADGTLLLTRGYNAAGEMYVAPRGTFLPVPLVPTDDDVDHALDMFLDTTRDFPFSDSFDGSDALPIRTGELDDDGHPLPNLERGESSRANFLALCLVPFARDLLGPTVPAFLINKSAPGTGAGYLADVLGAMLYDAKMPPTQVSPDPEETGKRLLASLRNGPAAVFLDNINHRVDSGPLASVLTSDKFKQRVLGSSVEVEVPVRCAWILSANSGRFSEELMRRIVPIQMDAACARPDRDRPVAYFKHRNFPTLVRARRLELVWSAHVLIQNWIARGRPLGSQSLATFQEFAQVMGGILDAAGVPGFLANLETYMDTLDETTDDLAGVLADVFKRIGGAPFTVADAATVTTEGDDLDSRWGSGATFGRGSARSRETVVGGILSKATGRVFAFGDASYQLQRGKDTTTRRALYLFRTL